MVDVAFKQSSMQEEIVATFMGGRSSFLQRKSLYSAAGARSLFGASCSIAFCQSQDHGATPTPRTNGRTAEEGCQFAR